MNHQLESINNNNNNNNINNNKLFIVSCGAKKINYLLEIDRSLLDRLIVKIVFVRLLQRRLKIHKFRSFSI